MSTRYLVAYRQLTHAILAIAALLLLFVQSSCSNEPDDPGSRADAATQQAYRIGGTVTGLAGELKLILNGAELVSLTTDGTFEFATQLSDGDAFLVTIFEHPAHSQCNITGQSGVVSGGDATDVVVSCSEVPEGFSVGGSVANLAADLHLVLNGSELVTVSANGSFSFSTVLQDGQSYLVTFFSQPEGQECTMTGDTGVVAGADVTDVAVACSDVQPAFTVGGTVIGLVGDLHLALNVSELATVSASGSFGFSTPLQSGDSYVVTILQQPQGQLCTVANASGLIESANVSDLVVLCDSLPSARLANLELAAPNAPNLPFLPNQLSYQLDVSVLMSEIRVIATTLDETASIVIDGIEILTGTPSPPIRLGVGSNVVDIVVTAENGDTLSYSIVIERGNTPISQDVYAKASNPNASDFFGHVLAMSGDTLVIGAPEEASSTTGVDGDQLDNTADNSGAVYVFRLSGDTWSQEAYLKASNTGANDEFGQSVSIAGDTIVVGAALEDSSATGIDGNQLDDSAEDSGAVYVFRRTGTVWSQEAYLKASNADAGDKFGISVAVSGEVIAVGATFEDSGAGGVNGDQSSNIRTNSGAAYVFRRTDAGWSQDAYLKATFANTGRRFGYSIAVHGDTVAVGAPFDGNGSVYLYRRAGGNWGQEAHIQIPVQTFSAEFGTSVSLFDDTLAVGTPRDASNATGVDGNPADSSSPSSGAVFLFHREGVTWSQEAYIKASNSESGDLFGQSVALREQTLVVGAWLEDGPGQGIDADQTNNNQIQSGAAYVFRRFGGAWSQEAYVKASNAETQDVFGVSVALSANGMAIGAWGEDSKSPGLNGNAGNNSFSASGAAYIFR